MREMKRKRMGKEKSKATSTRNGYTNGEIEIGYRGLATLLAGDRRRSGFKSDSLFITDTFSIAGGRTGSAESVVFVLIS